MGFAFVCGYVDVVVVAGDRHVFHPSELSLGTALLLLLELGSIFSGSILLGLASTLAGTQVMARTTATSPTLQVSISHMPPSHSATYRYWLPTRNFWRSVDAAGLDRVALRLHRLHLG